MKQISNCRIILIITFILSLAACSSAPKEIPLLEQARSDYNNASQDVTVVKHAPEELDKANDALKTADRHWKKKEERRDVEHYAYLVKQRVQIAQLIAESNETDRELEAMALERRNVTLNLREAELNQAKLRAAELELQMKMLQAEKTERGMVLTLGDVLFDINEASLAPGAERNIAKIAAFMRSYPERNAVIEGHTDSMGEADYNLDLSRDRAFAVRDALVRAGISSSRISTQGFGEALPVASNDNPGGRQKNRRVEIIFPDKPTQVSELED
jgi:outer membrane protein OmpA-like peptidoglycan-associated protein